MISLRKATNRRFDDSKGFIEHLRLGLLSMKATTVDFLEEGRVQRSRSGIRSTKLVDERPGWSGWS
jgi:hypothetical protein